MIYNTDIFELKAKLNKLKLNLDQEPANIHEKDLANKYMKRVLDLVDEIKI
jgi:hypothetical protein